MKISPINFAVNFNLSFDGRRTTERKWQTYENETGANKELAESPEDKFFRKLDREEFKDLVDSSLSSRERVVITRRYGLDGSEPESCKKIAKDLGTSEGIIKNREEKGLRKLKESLSPYYA